MALLKKLSDKIFLVKQKTILQNELKRLEEQIKLTKKFPEYGISNDDNIHEIEKFQENTSLQDSLKNIIKETKAALKRIEADKYGLCEFCKGIIEQGRLKAYPAATFCVSCASKKTKGR